MGAVQHISYVPKSAFEMSVFYKFFDFATRAFHKNYVSFKTPSEIQTLLRGVN
jgi:hypothetical protein